MIVTCGHCKHWLLFSAGATRGYCHLISNYQYSGAPTVRDAISYSVLNTGPDFGCTLGEAKEPTREDA